MSTMDTAMATTNFAAAEMPAPPPYPIRRFTVSDYHRMIEAGILGEDDRVELLEGCIVPKMTHDPPHDSTIQIVSECLATVLPVGWRTRIQSAITTGDSEPEPDLAIVRGHARTYAKRHPGPQDIGLVIEVVDSSLDQDRIEKARIYAQAGIATYWLINLIESRVEVFSDPTGPTAQPEFRHCDVFHDQQLVPLILDRAEIAEIPARDLLP
jgi:Uma2 family endonuclease